MKKAVFIYALLLQGPAFAWAEEAVHGAVSHATEQAATHSGGIPTSVVYQAINFAIYFALLFYFLRKPIVGFFSSREQVYKQALVKGETVRKEAEARKREIQQRLSALESSAAESLRQARAEAATLKQRIAQEAQDIAGRLEEETKRTINLEMERAKNQLREEMLSQAVALSQKLLGDKMAEPDQKRLQTEFVAKIQEVR